MFVAARAAGTGSIRMGSARVQASGSVGYGAAAGLAVGASRKGFGIQVQAGLGTTVGLALLVSWA